MTEEKNEQVTSHNATSPTLERIKEITVKHARGENAGIGSAEFAEILALARRAILERPVVEACLSHWEGEGICAICPYVRGSVPHATDCQFVVAGLIDREGSRR